MVDLPDDAPPGWRIHAEIVRLCAGKPQQDVLDALILTVAVVAGQISSTKEVGRNVIGHIALGAQRDMEATWDVTPHPTKGEQTVQ